MFSDTISNRIFTSVVLLVFIETICGSYSIPKNDMSTISIFYVIAGVLMAFLMMIKIRATTPSVSTGFERVFRWSHLIFLLFLTYSCVPIIQKYLVDIPIDFHNADMIPVLKIQAQRFLNFENVYNDIVMWKSEKPIYLTFMWLPFSISEFFKFDARWIPLLWTLIGVFFLAKMSHRAKLLLPSVLGIFSVYSIFNFMITQDKNTVIWAEEGVVVGYYIFLGYALSRKNAWLIGLGVAFCLLSRYFLVFWLPVFWLYWYFFQSKKSAWIILITSLSILFLTFLIPYGFKNAYFFLGQHNGYIEMAQRSWNDNPNFTLQTLGFAKFFNFKSIEFLHQFLIVSSALISIVCGGLFLKFRSKKWFQPEMFALCSLKLTMICFYNLLEMPFYYLFYTNTFFSYCLLFHYLNLAESVPSSEVSEKSMSYE